MSNIETKDQQIARLTAQLSALLDDPDYDGGIHWHNKRYNDLCMHSAKLLNDHAHVVKENASLTALVGKMREALEETSNALKICYADKARIAELEGALTSIKDYFSIPRGLGAAYEMQDLASRVLAKKKQLSS